MTKALKCSLPILFVLFITCQALACGGEEPEYKPEAALFFMVGLAEKGVAVNDNFVLGSGDDNETLNGWYKLLGLDPLDGTSREHLRYLLLSSTSEDIVALKAAFEGGELKGGLQNNRAAKALLETHDRGLLNYLVLTHDLDASGVFGGGWTYRDLDRGDMVYDGDRDQTTLQGFFDNRAGNTELALRYAYQHIRLLFYSKQHDAVIAFFENEINPLPDNAVKEWCRMFYGGSLYQAGLDQDAFAAYAIVFHRSVRYNFRAQESIQWLYGDLHRTFHNEYSDMVNERYPDDYDERRKLWDAYQAALDDARFIYFGEGYTKPLSDEERALVDSTLAYLHGDTENSLLSVLAMVAGGGETPVNLEDFLARQIGRLSYNVFTGSNPDFADSLDLEHLLLKVADKRPDPALWQLAAAQVAIMRRDADASRDYIDMAVTNGAEDVFPGQLLVTQILSEAWLGALDAESEARLGIMLQKLNALYDAKSYGDNNYTLHNAWVGILDTILPSRYAEQGRLDRVFFCLAVLNDHLEWVPDDEFFNIYRSYFSYWEYDNFGAILEDTAVLPQVTAVMQNPEGPLEQYFVSQLKTWNTNILYELQGINYALEHNFANAVAAFGQITQPPAEDFILMPAEVLLMPLSMGVIRANWPQAVTFYAPDHYEESWSWARSRFYDKIELVNIMADSDNTIYGWRWDGDDYAGLYEAAEAAGLNESSRTLLAYLTQEPLTFADFAAKMQTLQELSERDDELGAMAAYFYALGVYNMQIQGRLHQLQYDWPQAEVDYILGYLTRAANISHNDEIKARANFLSAGIIKHAQFMRAKNTYSWNFYSDADQWDANEFRPYYEALQNYRDTIFGREVFGNCTFAADFLQ